MYMNENVEDKFGVMIEIRDYDKDVLVFLIWV